MTIFDKIYQLTEKLSQALLKEEGFHDLDDSDIFSDNANIYIKQQLSEEEIKENLELLNKIDKEAAWQKMEYKMAPKRETHSKKFLPSYYKAAAVAIFFISLGYITYHMLHNHTQVELKQAGIPSGTDRAILTLEDGSDVVLEKGKPFKSGMVHGNGERLEYERNKPDSKTAYNYLTIPRGGQYQILLSDSTMVWLNSDSKIKYPVNFVEGEPRNLELVYGEAYFKVSPSTKNQGSVFNVLTKIQEVEVTGTEFNIKAYNDEKLIYTTLVEGQVNVVVEDKKQQLSPGEQAILKLDTKNITTHKVYVDDDIAWVKGYFNFKDKPLKEIMKVLSRWYDVDISFETQDLEQIKFSGLLSRKQNIEDILNGIKNTNFINAYEIKNKTITIK